MGGRRRKLTLSLHVATSVGLLGAVASFLALSLLGLLAGDQVVAKAAYISMDPIARWIIVPLAIGTLLVGVIQSMTTPWGLFRHYWVIAKLAVTVVVIGILLMQMGTIAALARYASTQGFDGASVFQPRLSLAVHAGLGLLVLLLPVLLSVYKPRGLTRFARS